MRIARTPWSLALVLAMGATLAACGSSGGSASPSPSSTPDASASAPSSAQGKPCVPVSDPLPAGAPQVPVKVGPPPTELVSEDLTPGTGTAATASSTVTVDYIGVSCSTGTIFDSSYASGQPVSFPLSNVIPGWQQGIPGMKVGGTRLLGIPASLAYGSTPPDGSGIAPDETLWFVVELKGVQS